MVRLYGKRPYRIVLVHGGPGAIGTLKGFSDELSRVSNIGVVEALQSKYTISELIEELKEQILENCEGRVYLIGHSWGARLAGIGNKNPVFWGRNNKSSFVYLKS